MDPTSAGAAFGSFVLATATTIWGVISSRKATDAQNKLSENQKVSQRLSSDDLAKSNLEVASAYKARADEWKGEYDRQHAEIMAYRDWVHEKAKKDQAEYLSVVKENESLKARTDLSPVIEHMFQQTENSAKILDVLTKLTTAIDTLTDKLSK